MQDYRENQVDYGVNPVVLAKFNIHYGFRRD